jgi:hypothetical protein
MTKCLGYHYSNTISGLATCANGAKKVFFVLVSLFMARILGRGF